MDQKQIEKLMSVMEGSRIKRIVIKRGDFELELEKECADQPVVYAASPPPPAFAGSHDLSEKKSAAPTPSHAGHFITSPMVGTFYASPSPDDPAYVKPGDAVKENSVVCIVEAMKVMNEVKAGLKGKVIEVLLRNGDPVEFGTKIFRVETA